MVKSVTEPFLKEATVSHPDTLGLSFCAGPWSSADAVSQQHSALLRCLTHPVWYEHLALQYLFDSFGIYMDIFCALSFLLQMINFNTISFFKKQVHDNQR